MVPANLSISMQWMISNRSAAALLSFTACEAWAKCQVTFGGLFDEYRWVKRSYNLWVMLACTTASFPFAPPMCDASSYHTREREHQFWIKFCEATTRRIGTCFDVLLMKVIRYTTDYGALYTKDMDHGSVVCHPVDETVLHHHSPFRYVHATKCQLYFGQNWVFSTNELMTHN